MRKIRKMRVQLIVIIIALLAFCNACSTAGEMGADKNLEELVLPAFGYLPKGFSDEQAVIRQMPQRCQIRYYDKNGEEIVFEIIIKGIDNKKISEYEEVEIRGDQGMLYLYGEENTIDDYGKEQFGNNAYFPEENQYVIDWEGKQFEYRLFGDINQEELIKIAESINL